MPRCSKDMAGSNLRDAVGFGRDVRRPRPLHRHSRSAATLARRKSMTNIREIADAWARAGEGADSEAFAALFSDEMEYRDDQAGRVSRSPEELKAFHQHF